MTGCQRKKAGFRTVYLDDQVRANYIYVCTFIKAQEGYQATYQSGTLWGRGSEQMFDVYYAISVWYEFLTMDHFDHKKISDLKKKSLCLCCGLERKIKSANALEKQLI